jgi:hypothetical protein
MQKNDDYRNKTSFYKEKEARINLFVLEWSITLKKRIIQVEL